MYLAWLIAFDVVLTGFVHLIGLLAGPEIAVVVVIVIVAVVVEMAEAAAIHIVWRVTVGLSLAHWVVYLVVRNKIRLFLRVHLAESRLLMPIKDELVSSSSNTLPSPPKVKHSHTSTIHV